MTATPLDLNDIPVGGPGVPLATGHLDAHSQLSDRLAALQLPPPYDGSGIGTHVDSRGEVWVAKADVLAGAWRKAHDAVKARAYRTGAFVASQFGPIVYDTHDGDSLNLFNLANGQFVCPLTGSYKALAAFSVTASAASNFAAGEIRRSGVSVAQGAPNFAVSAGNGVMGIASDIIPCSAGDTLTMVSIGHGLTGIPGLSRTYMSVHLLSTT